MWLGVTLEVCPSYHNANRFVHKVFIDILSYFMIVVVGVIVRVKCSLASSANGFQCTDQFCDSTLSGI